MRISTIHRGFGFLLGLFASVAVATAQSGESSFSVGYSHFRPEHDGGLFFFDKDGAYFDADFGWRVPYYQSPIVLGLGLSGSGYFEQQDVTVPFNNNVFGQATLDSSVGLLAIEPRVALELWVPGARGVFIKPRIGAGMLIDSYSVDNEVMNNGNTFFNTQDFTGLAFEVRPAVQAGYSWGPGSVGLELSYMAAWGGFGRLGNVRTGISSRGIFYLPILSNIAELWPPDLISPPAQRRHPTTSAKRSFPPPGWGTRHFPASFAVKKELFPIVGPDGIARALIHYHLLELAAAGIEEICIIVQPGDDGPIRQYLEGPDAAYLKRLEKYPALAAEAKKMRELSGRVRFAVQREQEGYGHAVYQTKAFAAGEMVLLCLGDHLFRGQRISPYRQLTEMATVCQGKSVSAVNRIGPDDLKGFGTIAGQRWRENPQLIDVSLIIEKPDVQIARQNLRVDGLGENEFLGWFGMHLLRASIYDVLEEMIRDDMRDNGEFQLTRAQEIQRQREGYLALEIIGAERFDFGVPDDFVRSLQSFRNF